MSYEDDIDRTNSGIEVELSLNELDRFLKSISFKIPYFKDPKGKYLEYVSDSPHTKEEVHVRIYSISGRKQRIVTYVERKRLPIRYHEILSPSDLDNRDQSEEKDRKSMWELIHNPQSHKRIIEQGDSQFWNAVNTGIGVLGTIGLYSLYKRGVSST